MKGGDGGGGGVTNMGCPRGRDVGLPSSSAGRGVTLPISEFKALRRFDTQDSHPSLTPARSSRLR